MARRLYVSQNISRYVDPGEPGGKRDMVRRWKEAFERSDIADRFLVLQIALLVAVGMVFRFVQLGYSDLQGDEILTLCRVSEHKSFIHFLAYLFAQRKGPVQYLITCTFSLFDPGFSSELALRLPFAIANFAALVCFFGLARWLFTLRVAVYAAFLLAVNGIFIAFARIVQYQSFVILGGVLGILSLMLALLHERWKVAGLYIAFLAAAMSLLAHFDAAFFLPPMGVLVLHWWMKYRSEPEFPRLRWHLFVAIALFAIPVLGFYVEYASRLDSFQLSYWEERRVGDSTDILRLFQFYNPGPLLWLCAAWVALGFTRLRTSLAWQVIAAWFVPPLVFMTLLFKDSRTHAYTYLLPLFLVAGLGVDVLMTWLKARLLRGKSFQWAQASLLLVFLSLAYINYQVYIDHRIEYPWHPKRVLGMEFEGGFVAGTFGFPYSRQWREIGDWFDALPTDGERLDLVTNEKRQFIQFYLPAKVHHRLNCDTGDFPSINVNAPHGIYILIVQSPQSWTRELWGLSLSEWRATFTPIHDFVNADGDLLASVYYLSQAQIDAQFHK